MEGCWQPLHKVAADSPPKMVCSLSNTSVALVELVCLQMSPQIDKVGADSPPKDGLLSV